ncbi:MAG: histidine kinase [Pedobacter sp.]|nr:MAG: histidine kinase [Pedobacter sp.]
MLLFFRTLLFLMVLLPTVLLAQQPPAISSFGYGNIGKKITWYEDKSSSLELSQIKELDAAGKFKVGKQDILNFGQSKSAFWLKIKYRVQNAFPMHLILDAPNVEHIEYYFNEANGKEHAIKSGCLSLEMPDVSISNNFMFKLPMLGIGRESVIYLKLKTSNILMAPVKISSSDDILKGAAFKDRIEYIYIGVLMALLIFNLFLFVSLKDITYLYYTIYVLTLSSYLLFYIRGYGFLFGENSRILINHHPHVLLSLSVISSLLFCYKFLNLKQTAPVMMKFYYLLAFVGTLLFFTSILGYKALSTSVAQLLTITVSVVVWISGVIAYRNGHKPAKYYIIAWFFIWITVGIVTLSLAGVLETTEFTVQLVPIGSTIELLLLSFALGNRYKIIIQAEQAARDENLMLITTQNQRLEQSVQERTQQLNKLFSIIAHDLRSPLNSLISILSLSEMNVLNLEDFQSLLSKNKKNIETINNTLNNLLYWAKQQMEGSSTQPEQFDLALLMEELLLVYLPLANKKNIQVNTDIRDFVAPAFADINQIKLVLRNLIDNAIKFTPQGEKINLGLSYKNKTIEVYVANTISEQSRLKLKDTMDIKIIEATYGTANEKGVGLGLHLCREYLKNNGSQLKSHVEGNQIFFNFSLPDIKD